MKTSWASGLFRNHRWETVFLAALLLHFCCCMVGWNHPLLDHQSYRQTQTAMASEFMIRDGAWINYMTPVLGPPWQVPLEFPLYQMLVAGLCLVLHTPVDQTGRAVSLFFFYAALWPMNLFLKRWVPEKRYRCMILSLVLVAPLYIYFSRVVMIESMALFLGFWFLVLVQRQLGRPSPGGMAALLAAGSLCALVKITTFCAFCFPCLILPVLYWIDWAKNRAPGWRNMLLRQAWVLAAAYAVPLMLGVWWTHRVDEIKRASPATENLTSAGLSSWNFGTLAQRLDPQCWFDLSARISFGLTFYPLLLIPLVALFFIRREDRRIVGLLLVAALLPALVFFNLHIVHDYYFYASSVFLIFALGYLITCLLRKESKWGKPVWLVLVLSFLTMYGAFFFRVQWGRNVIMADVIEAIQENSGKDEYLLIYGEVWDSKIPYYTDRKAFMNYYFGREAIQEFDARLDRVEGWDHVRLAVVNTDALPMEPYLQQRLVALGFPAQPDLRVHGFSIYRRKTGL